MIDLRSDTFTTPSEGMLRAMLTARVGDDNYGEDWSTNDLENRCAELFGHEAAVFMPTGTLSNQIALRVHSRPGDEVVIDESYHLNTYESAPSSDLAGISLNCVRTADGVLRPHHVIEAIDKKARDARYAQVVLVCTENTINNRSGRVVPLADMRHLYEYTRTASLAVHLDGARLCNAAVASSTHLQQYGSVADTVSLCFAKGLGAPLGSILVGSGDLMSAARYFRKSYGGALHQSGYMAAAASYALDHNLERLADDHATASTLASLIDGHKLIRFDPTDVQSNIVLIDVSPTGRTAEEIASRLAERGVLCVATSRRHLRLVTRMGIEESDVQVAAKVILGLLDSFGSLAIRCDDM